MKFLSTHLSRCWSSSIVVCDMPSSLHCRGMPLWFFWPLMSTKCRRSPAGINGGRENISESDKRFPEFCCGGGGGGSGGDGDVFIDCARHYTLRSSRLP